MGYAQASDGERLGWAAVGWIGPSTDRAAFALWPRGATAGSNNPPISGRPLALSRRATLVTGAPALSELVTTDRLLDRMSRTA